MWVVVPPQAMPTVSCSGPRVIDGASGCDMIPWARCAWGSTPPGATILPVASMMRADAVGSVPGSADRRDALAFDAHVPGADTLGSDDLSAANHEIEHDGPPFFNRGGPRWPPPSLPQSELRRQAGARTAVTPTRSPK